MIWICEKGHEWKAAVSDRTRGSECPVCQNRKLLKGYNDLASLYPKIASEWDYERNNGKLPEDVIFSLGHHYHWRCSRNHTWSATAKSRTQNNTGCPKCNAYTQSSFPQEAVIFYLSKAFNVAAREKVAGKELDAYLTDYKIGVEYDGWWHSFDGVKDRDDSKNATMKEAGVSLYRIAESMHFNFDRSNQRIEYFYTKDCSSLKKPIDLLLRWLSEETGVDCSGISVDCIRDRQSIDTQMNRGSLANSFGERSSKYLVEWHPTKNRGLTPFQFTVFSGKRVWWKCSYCGCDWEASFADRSYSKGLGCPLCSVRRAATDRCRKVLQFDLDRTKVRVWSSAKEAVSITGIKTIASACRGDQKTAGGYIWRYAQEP